MSPLDETRRDWQNREERCRKLSDAMRGDTTGARLAALAHEIDQQVQDWNELVSVAEQRQRHCRAILAEIDVLLDRTRLELSFSRLRPNQAYSADNLRVVALLCHDEALAGQDTETRRAFAGRASELAMMSEAIIRKEREPAVVSQFRL